MLTPNRNASVTFNNKLPLTFLSKPKKLNWGQHSLVTHLSSVLLPTFCSDKNVLPFLMGWSNKDAKDKTRYCGHFVKLCLTSCGAMSAFTHWKHLLLLSYYQSSMFMVWYVCILNCVNAEFHSVPTVLFILVEKKNLSPFIFSNIRYLFIYVFMYLFVCLFMSLKMIGLSFNLDVALI